jgi:polyphenol oxidase
MRFPEELHLVRPPVFSGLSDVVAVQTTRKGGCSPSPYASLNLGAHTADDTRRVEENFRRLNDFLDLPGEGIVLTEQVHGTEIRLVDRPGKVSGFDALITATPGIFPGIVTADCYPVLVHDPEHRASAAIHAGWQGTAGRITEKTIEAMREAFGTRPEACLAWVGTGISAERYEIGGEVADHFGERYLRSVTGEKGKFLLDLSLANRDQLLAAGIPAERIECSAWCTSRDSELFFSYRRDRGATGRMLSLIGVRCSG